MADHGWVGFWVRRFLAEHLMLERGVSRNTQQSYRDTFCLFLPFVAARRQTSVDKLVIDDLSPKIVLDFLSHLEQARSCSVATRNQRLATLHAFARFTAECSPDHVEWCRQIRNVPFKRTGRDPVPYMEKDEIDELLRAPDRTSEQGQRDYALLLFLYNSGARASEAVRVAIEDLTWDSTGTGSVKIHGKGKKVRFCPLWKKTMLELQPLIRGRGRRQSAVSQPIRRSLDALWDPCARDPSCGRCCGENAILKNQAYQSTYDSSLFRVPDYCRVISFPPFFWASNLH